MAMRRILWLSILTRLVISLVVLFIAVGIFSTLVNTKPEPGRRDEDANRPRVVVFESMPVSVSRQWNGFGTARAEVTSDVPARVTTIVRAIPETIKDGAAVAAGDVIAELDDSDFVRQAEIAQAAIDNYTAEIERIAIETESWQRRLELATEEVQLAQAEFDRATRARQGNAAKQREVDQARQALIAAIRAEVAAKEELAKQPVRKQALEALRFGQEAQLKLARQNIQRCTITSPIRGYLQTVDIEVGENLTSGQRVARVVDLTSIEIPIRLPAGARSFLAIDAPVQMHAAGDGSRQWDASIARIVPEDDPQTRTVVVFVQRSQEWPSPDAIAPGQFLRAIVSANHPEQCTIVPRRSIRDDRVKVVRDGFITSIEVRVAYDLEGYFKQLGVPDSQWVVLVDALPEGAQVVLSPTRSLREAMQVEPVLYESTPAQRASRIAP
jgi:multidrug efflux pump subunit AcrA (membrane-fusion protein)